MGEGKGGLEDLLLSCGVIELVFAGSFEAELHSRVNP